MQAYTTQPDVWQIALWRLKILVVGLLQVDCQFLPSIGPRNVMLSVWTLWLIISKIILPFLCIVVCVCVNSGANCSAFMCVACDLPYRQDYVHGWICADRLSLYYTTASLYVPTVLWTHFNPPWAVWHSFGWMRHHPLNNISSEAKMNTCPNIHLFLFVSGSQ